jgi:hypothetical protein
MENRVLKFLPFVMEEANLLLQAKIGMNGWSGSKPDSLLKVLECIPFAVTQAAAFVKRNRMSLRKYLDGVIIFNDNA